MANENIRNFLNSYIENPDPRYAVMLKGKWGCGKTFFVDRWLRDRGDRYEVNPSRWFLIGSHDTIEPFGEDVSARKRESAKWQKNCRAYVKLLSI